MKKLLTAGYLFLVAISAAAQSSLQYATQKRIADSLHKEKDFKSAALILSSFSLKNKETEIDEKWIAACYWMEAGLKDSTYAVLERIAAIPDLGYDFVFDLTNDSSCFATLFTETRWHDLSRKMLESAWENHLGIIKTFNGKIPFNELFELVVGWTMRGEIDSAFAYLDRIAAEPTKSFGRNLDRAEVLLPLQKDTRWQQVVRRIYHNTARLLSARYQNINLRKKTTVGFDAARAWAMAGQPDSAFYYLETIVRSEVDRFIDFNALTRSNEFRSLYTLPRWKALAERVKKDFSPLSCEHIYRAPPIPIKCVIDKKSKFLRPDKNKAYLNGMDKVSSLDQTAFNLNLSGSNLVYNPYDGKNLSSRFLELNLTEPIAGTGSTALGKIRDHAGSVHVFYRIDRNLNPALIYNFRQLPIGETVESPRTEINIHINSELYTLILGDWALGDCNENYAYGGKINGSLSSKVKITRHSASSVTVEAGKGSIGRLWRTENMTKPVDLGLYRTGFRLFLEYE